MANPTLFNRSLYRARRNRIAHTYPNHDFLKREACNRLLDRLEDMTRSFPLAVELGCHTGQLAETLAGSDKVGTLVQCDSAEKMVKNMSLPRRRESFSVSSEDDSRLRGNDKLLVADEELLPFAENSVDAVFSLLSLHHVNDLVGTLIQAQRILKPDGLFLAILPGPQTLNELRDSFTVADVATRNGLSPYISPFMDVRDAGNLLQRAGFALPVIDNELLTITYADPHALMAELRGMGETNCLNEQRSGLIRPESLASACLHYMSEYGYEEETRHCEEGESTTRHPERSGEPLCESPATNADGDHHAPANASARNDEVPTQRIKATVEFVTLTAWKPDASQQQPARRGSGEVSLGDFFE